MRPSPPRPDTVLAGGSVVTLRFKPDVIGNGFDSGTIPLCADDRKYNEEGHCERDER